jgi:hypothetical protein
MVSPLVTLTSKTHVKEERGIESETSCEIIVQNKGFGKKLGNRN